jgi:hypothetical protein
MLLATSLLALSLVGGPAKPCTAPTLTGIFRITAINKDSTNAKTGMILLESVDNCLEASIITDDASPALIDQLSLSNDVLTGEVRMPSGVGHVKIKLTPTALDGVIEQGKYRWSLSGHRTSGVETRSANGDVKLP